MQLLNTTFEILKNKEDIMMSIMNFGGFEIDEDGNEHFEYGKYIILRLKKNIIDCTLVLKRLEKEKRSIKR